MSKLATLTLVLALAAAARAGAQTNLTAETAAPTGVPGTTILSLAEFAAERGIADIQVTTGQTLTNSVQNLAEGKTDISAAPFVLPFLLSRGSGPYAALGQDKGAEEAGRLAVLYTYRFGVMALYAYSSQGLSGWEGLKGQVVFDGPPRGAALTTARGVIKLATGLDEGSGYTGLQVNWGQSVKTILDGSAQAVVLPIGFPDTRLTAAVAAGGITLWSYPKAVYRSPALKTFLGAPGSGTFDIPLADATQPEGVAVRSEDDRFRGVAMVGGDLVRRDMTDRTAYALTKAVIENVERIRDKAPFMKTVGLGEVSDPASTGMCGAMPIKYHPGAIRAWEEAGYTVPPCARP